MSNICIVELDETVDNVARVTEFRKNAVESCAPALTTPENESKHDEQFYKNLMKHSYLRSGIILLFAVVDDGKEPKGKREGDDEREIVGMIGAKFDLLCLTGESHNATLQGLFVKEEYRKHHIGKALVTQLIKVLDNTITNIFAEVVVMPGHGSISFYERIGFNLVGAKKRAKKYKDEHFDVAIMQTAI